MGYGDLRLKESADGQAAQMWVESADNGQLTTGTVNGVTALWCNEDGSVSVTFPGVAIARTRKYVAGDMVGFLSPVSVAISSGMFSCMVA